MASKRIVQVLFVVVNCIFLLAGILLIAAGGFALAGHLDELIPIPNFNAIAGIIIAVGLLVLGISLFGLIGGAKRNNVLLRIYFVALLIIVIVQMAVGIGALALRPQLDNLLSMGWQSAYNTTQGRSLLTTVQKALNCCGFNNPMDFPGPECPAGANVGCLPAMHDLTNSQLLYIGVAALLIGFVEIASLVVSCFLNADPDKATDHRSILQA